MASVGKWQRLGDEGRGATLLHGSAGWRRELGGVEGGSFPDTRIPAVPFKAKAACRRHIPKQQHRVTNWAEYDAALRARGSLTVWFTPEVIRGLGGSAAHHPGRAGLLLRSGDHDGPDAANRVPPGAAPDRGADRLRPATAWPRSPGAGSQHPQPLSRDAGGAATKGGERAGAP